MKQKISITIEESILKELDTFIDNIYIRNRSQAIENLISNSLQGKRDAVILAGGPEESLRIDKDNFRMTVQIKGKTLIERAVEKLKKARFTKIFIIARPEVLNKIFEILRDGSKYGVDIKYIEENRSKGTADSLRLLKGEVKTNFLVVYSDILFDKINIDEIWKQHQEKKPVATLMLTTSANPSEKGIVKIEGSKILNFTQKPKKTDTYLGFSSMFVAAPEIIHYEGKSLEDEIFPLLAEKGLLQGHLSSEKELHVHSIQDIKNIEAKR